MVFNDKARLKPKKERPIKELSKSDQSVLRLLSEGMSDHEVCRNLGMSLATLAKSIGRIEARAAAESEDAGRYYERALRRRSERKIIALNARLHSLMDAIPQAVLIIDGRTGAIKEFNMLACTMFGYTSYALEKLTVEDLVSKKVRSKHVGLRLGFLSSIRKREMGYHPPIFGLRADGSEIEMDIALTATQVDDDVMVVCSERNANASGELIGSKTELAL